MTQRLVYKELYKKPEDERKSDKIRIWQVMEQITKVNSELRKCKIDVFEPTVSCIIFFNITKGLTYFIKKHYIKSLVFHDMMLKYTTFFFIVIFIYIKRCCNALTQKFYNKNK